MEDDMEVKLTDLYVNEIQELLAEQGQEVSLEQAQMIANFVKEVGSLEERWTCWLSCARIAMPLESPAHRARRRNRWRRSAS